MKSSMLNIKQLWKKAKPFLIALLPLLFYLPLVADYFPEAQEQWIGHWISGFYKWIASYIGWWFFYIFFLPAAITIVLLINSTLNCLDISIKWRNSNEE